jgi:LPXTG-motif cell wall-anchored protein
MPLGFVNFDFAEATVMTPLVTSEAVVIGAYSVEKVDNEIVVTFTIETGYELVKAEAYVAGDRDNTLKAAAPGAFEIKLPINDLKTFNVQFDLTVKSFEVVGYSSVAQENGNPNPKTGNNRFVLSTDFQKLALYRTSHLVGNFANFMLGNPGNTELNKEYLGLVYVTYMPTLSSELGYTIQNVDKINYILNKYPDIFNTVIHNAIKSLATGTTVSGNDVYDDAMANGNGYLPLGANARIGIVMTAGPGNAGKKDFEDMIFSLPVKGSEAIVTPVMGWVEKSAGASVGFIIEDPVVEEPVIEEPGDVEEPVVEEPVVEEPGDVEEPGVEEPVVEEPDVEEPVVEEPVVEEPVVVPIIQNPIITPVPEVIQVVATTTPVEITTENLVPAGQNPPALNETEDPEEETVEASMVPFGTPDITKLPQTGELPPYAYYAAGMLLVGMGLGFRKKF